MEDIKAVIKSKTEVAKGTLLVEYNLLGKTVDFKPGQHFHVILPSGLKHHLTIVNSPNQKGILSHITRIRDSDFKKELVGLPLGTEVLVGKIKGEFVLPKETSTPMVFIALGIGITPYLCMLDYLQEEFLPFDITLLYSDSDTKSMAYLEKLQNLAQQNSQLKLILTITKDPSWQGENNHIDEQFIKKYLKEPEKYLYYISGAPTAVLQILESLKKIGVSADRTKTEEFTGY